MKNTKERRQVQSAIKQPTLFDWKPPANIRFNGAEYVPSRDDARLSGQLADIYELMKDGKWRTLDAISIATGHPQASVSAQLRHLRKPRFGSHEVSRRHVQNGLFEYKLGS